MIAPCEAFKPCCPPKGVERIPEEALGADASVLRPRDFLCRIGVYDGLSMVSRVIQWRTWSDVSHVSLITHHGLTLESVPFRGVVKHEGLDAYHRPGTKVDIYRVEHAPALTARIVGFALMQEGKAYDWRGILGFLSRRAGAQNQDRWFCSEYVFEAFRQAGVDLLARVESYQVAPCDILRSPLLTYERTVITQGWTEEDAE
jgi:uncharacterized protein YycO